MTSDLQTLPGSLPFVVLSEMSPCFCCYYLAILQLFFVVVFFVFVFLMDYSLCIPIL